MRARRLFAIAAAMSLLACIAAIVLLAGETRRMERTRVANEARLRNIPNDIQRAEREPAVYSDKILDRIRRGKMSTAELKHAYEHVFELGNRSTGLIMKESRLQVTVYSQTRPPPVDVRTVLLTAALPVLWVLWWAWTRLWQRYRQLPNLNLADSEHRDAMREANRRASRHWQTWVGIAVILPLTGGTWWLCRALWPQSMRGGGLGFLLTYAAAGFGAAVGFATFAPVVAQEFHRELIARGFCPSCGYDLRATPGRCPECGWHAAESGAG